jgi:type I restriction enzyme M protein
VPTNQAASILGDAYIVHDQSGGLVAEHAVHTGNRLHQAVFLASAYPRTLCACKGRQNRSAIDADIRWNNEWSSHKDELKDKRFDFILANPPFNTSDMT